MTTTETVFNDQNAAEGTNVSNPVIEGQEQPQNGQNDDDDDDDDDQSDLLSEEYQSEQLTKLREEYQTAGQQLQLTKFGGKKWQTLSESVAKLTSQIRAEIQGIKRQKRDAEIQAQKDTLTSLAKALYDKAFAAGYATGQNQPAENLEFLTAKATGELDNVTNALLAGFSPAKPANVTNGQNGQTGQPAHGSVRAEIERLYADFTAKGMNVTDAIKAIKEQGFSRGSTNTYVRDYRLKVGEITE